MCATIGCIKDAEYPFEDGWYCIECHRDLEKEFKDKWE